VTIRDEAEIAEAPVLARMGSPPRGSCETGWWLYQFDRFSEDTRRVLSLAQQEAERAGHGYIGTEHMLLALLRSGTGAARLLERLGVEEQQARATIERALGGTGRLATEEIPSDRMVPTSRVKKVIELSFAIADREAGDQVVPEHVLLAVLEEGEGIAAHVLHDLGVTPAEVMRDRLGGPGETGR